VNVLRQNVLEIINEGVRTPQVGLCYSTVQYLITINLKLVSHTVHENEGNL